MKKLLILILALVMCFAAFTACKKEDPTPEVTYNLEKATTYVRQLYIKGDGSVTASDFEVVSKVTVAGVGYDVEWTVDTDKVTVVPGTNGAATVIDVNEKSDEEYTYKLTATIKAGDGTSATLEFTYTVPVYNVMSFEDYMNAAEGDTVTVEGIVVAINSKDKGNSRNHLFLADATAKGGYYSYQMDADPIKDLGIEVGMTVSVTGPITPYSGMQEIKGGVATIVDRTIKTVDTLDITNEFASGASLKNYVALPVTIKGVTIGAQDLATATSQYLYFSLGEKQGYIRTYVTDFPTTLVADDKATIDAAHAAKFGWTANVTGILVLYNSAPYLIPMSVDCFEYLNLVEKTDAEKVAAELDAAVLDTNFTSDAEVEVALTGKYYNEVALTWASNNEAVVVADGKLTITIPEEKTTVTITVTATLGDVTESKEIVLTLSKTVTPVKDVIALGSSMSHNEYTTGKYLVAGVITEVYNEQYGNMKITDELGNILTIYGTYDIDGTNRYDAMENKPVAGDYVVILGIVGQYSGTPQVKNGWIQSFTTPTSVKDAIDLGAAKEHNDYTGDKILVTGVITEVYNEKYGNMRITDAEGNILTIYGTYDATGLNRYDAMETKPVAGDTVTIYGVPGRYNDEKQIKNGWIVAVTKATTPDTDCEHEYVDGVCTKCGEADPDYVAPTPDPAPAGDVLVEGTIANKVISDNLTYITNNASYPDPSFYSDGGLKLNYVNQGVSTSVFEAQNSVKVTLTFNALNENTKSDTADLDAFTIYGLDASGNVVATASSNTIDANKTLSVTLEGTGIVSVKVIMTDYYHNGNKCCNLSLASVKVEK